MSRSSLFLPVRYLTVGAICALGQNALIIGGDLLGYHYTLTATLAVTIFGALGYALHSRYTYDQPLSWSACGRFIMGLGSGYVLSVAILAIFRDVMNVPMIITAPVATIIVTTWGFIASRWAITLARPPSSSIRADRQRQSNSVGVNRADPQSRA
jgi:putative flippase GtrA